MNNSISEQRMQILTKPAECFDVGAGVSLFQVRGNIPVTDALNQAACFLEAALPLVYEMAHDLDSSRGHGAAYHLESAKGLLEAVSRGLTRG